MAETKPHTHRAYATKREGQSVRWLEIGIATMRQDARGFDVYLDRLPVGGFNGHLVVLPNEVKPEEIAER